MATQVLFIHGGGGGAYDADAALAASLRTQLGPGYDVRYPRMPDEDEPDYATWAQIIARELAAMGPGAILVGHSIGASVAIKALADGMIHTSLAGVFLVAAPFWHDHDFWHWDDVRLPDDVAERIPRDVPVFLYHGREDKSVPVAHVEMYARALPRAVVHRLDDRDHQLNDDLGVVAAEIRQLA